MTHIITALIPIFALILIGYFFKKIAFPAKEFWPMADKFTYYVLMPALLIYKLSFAPPLSGDSVYVVLSGIISLCIMVLLLILCNAWLKFDGSSFTSIVQGGIRFNTYVLLAFVDGIFGDQGLLIAVLLLTFMIPTINIICISLFAIYVPKTHLSIKNVIKSIATNPLIVACVIGGLINTTDLVVPIILEKTLLILSNAALPLGLLSVGVGLHFREILTSKLGLILSSSIKLIVYPFTAFLVASYFELGNLETSVVVLFSAMPTAVTSYILARQLGGNLNLMSSIITFQTLISILSLTVILPLLQA